MCPYCQKTFKTCVNCKKHMKTHRQEIAQQLSQGTSNIGGEATSLPTANEAHVANVTDNMAYTQEVELIEVSCPADVHLNQALQATQLAVSGHQKTIIPQYHQSSTHELDQSNMVQQPAVIQDYRNTVVNDLQLQNVFGSQVGCLIDSECVSVFVFVVCICVLFGSV